MAHQKEKGDELAYKSDFFYLYLHVIALLFY